MLLSFICQFDRSMEIVKLWFIHVMEYYVAFKMFTIGNAYKWNEQNTKYL